MSINRQLDEFLASVQNRAFVTAKLAVNNDDEALDLVQDAMLKLAKNYAKRAPNEWGALFQTVLQNGIRDWYRRQKVRRILFWFEQEDLTDADLNHNAGESAGFRQPDQTLQDGQLNRDIQAALKKLPLRQQQAFILRAWWEHSVEETAEIMGCSQGSVKTHYFRATKALAGMLDNSLVGSVKGSQELSHQ